MNFTGLFLLLLCDELFDFILDAYSSFMPEDGSWVIIMWLRYLLLLLLGDVEAEVLFAFVSHH